MRRIVSVFIVTLLFLCSCQKNDDKQSNPTGCMTMEIGHCFMDAFDNSENVYEGELLGYEQLSRYHWEISVKIKNVYKGQYFSGVIIVDDLEYDDYFYSFLEKDEDTVCGNYLFMTGQKEMLTSSVPYTYHMIKIYDDGTLKQVADEYENYLPSFWGYSPGDKNKRYYTVKKPKDYYDMLDRMLGVSEYDSFIKQMLGNSDGFESIFKGSANVYLGEVVEIIDKYYYDDYFIDPIYKARIVVKSVIKGDYKVGETVEELVFPIYWNNNFYYVSDGTIGTTNIELITSGDYWVNLYNIQD
jgi:hypothetical protein